MPVAVDSVNASHMAQTEWNEAASGMQSPPSSPMNRAGGE